MPINLADLPMPITLRPATPLSDDDLMRFSAQNKPYKIERNKDGELTIMTPVGGIGSTHELDVSFALKNWTIANGTGIAFSPSTGFNLPDGSCLSSAAAWLPLTRWNALTSKEQADSPPLCPEFLIEIRSQSDSRRLLEAKMQLWIDNGAQLAWLIDPIEANVAIYRPAEPTETLERPDLLLGHPPVAGFELHTTHLWLAL